MEQKIYIANCIEHEERFVSLFKTIETDKQKLYDMGQEHAQGWGAECITVKLWKPRVTKNVKIKQGDKICWVTERKLNNFFSKCPQAIERTEILERKNTVEEPPENVYDNDLSSDENLKNYKERLQKEKEVA